MRHNPLTQQSFIDATTLGPGRLLRRNGGLEHLRADLGKQPWTARRLPELFRVGVTRQDTAGHGLVGPAVVTGRYQLPQDRHRNRCFADIGIGASNVDARRHFQFFRRLPGEIDPLVRPELPI